MPKAWVKCLICGKQFDRLSEPCEKIGRRYVHKKCYEENKDNEIKQEIDKNNFYQYIKEIYGPDYNYISISKQAENYIKVYGFTYSGMLKTLKWFYEIKHGNKEQSNQRIGIIPYIYQDARKYYKEIRLAQERNKEVNDYTLETKETVIASPRVYAQPPKLFDLGEEE